MLVSHDRYFMDHLVDQLFIFEGDGKIRLFNGNYSDYRDWIEDQELENLAKPVKVVLPEKLQPDTRRKASFKEKQEYEKLQQEIELLEKHKTDLTALINQGSLDHLQLQKWAQELQNITDTIELRTMRWLELAEII